MVISHAESALESRLGIDGMTFQVLSPSVLLHVAIGY